MNIEEVFKEVSAQMRSDFERSRSALSHPGLKGSSNEEIVKSFLRQYLPKNLEISTGLAVDSKGRVSRQLDIIVHDAAKTPIFFQSSETRVIPAECIYAVIEVKASLDKVELEKSFQNMQSVKNLEKVAFFKPNSAIVETKNLYGKEWLNWPIAHFIFAFSSPSLESVLSNLQVLETGLDVHKRIDTICVLDKGVILNQALDGGLTALPSPNSQLAASVTEKPLLLFYTLISIVLNQATMKPFNIHPYLGQIKF
ncbi:MAG: DUF6602 domain-containing protein [Thiohalocapsa sp.]